MKRLQKKEKEMNALFEKDQTVEQIHKIAKLLGENKVVLTNVGTEEIEQVIRLAGNKFGSVQFIKRTDNKLRKMCYRLHVKNPTFAIAPKGNTNRKGVNKRNTQMTVFNTNKVHRDKNGNIEYDETGKQQRGAWRTIPLENVKRVFADGVEYIVQDSK